MKPPLLFLLLLVLLVPELVEAFGPRKPEITGQRQLSTNEDTPITLNLFDLTVEDRDDFYPFGFSMQILPGEHYTAENRVITPEKNWNGVLSVNVTVNDGHNDSKVFPVKITVISVNDPPVIKSQVALSTMEGTPLTLAFANLTVEDPDNGYPTGFSMNLQPGGNYTVNNTTLTPNAGFTGTLSVPVTVSDGLLSSAAYNVQITVIAANKKPVITGHNPISTAKNLAFKINLSDLQVTDPDSRFPDDFTLTVHAGTNYSASGNTVTPTRDFVGTLSVKVSVNDGHSSSDIANVQVSVQDKLVITGQEPVESNEDEPYTPTLAMLKVYDPESKFPTGYSIQLEPGDHYAVAGSGIVPEANYNGSLVIGLKISNGLVASDVFAFTLKVLPVNDPPEVINFPEDPVKFTIGAGAKTLYENLEPADPDDTSFILAEVGFTTGYEAGSDMLTFITTGSINSVFDSERGVLSLIGEAPISAYKAALENIAYDYINLENPVPQNKAVYLKISDGKSVSILYEREIVAGENFELDIPTAFSPNADQANDTWKIKPHRVSERYSNTIIRVFSDRGVLVFETVGFDEEWDGNYGGKPVPSGSYLYVVDLNINYETTRLTGSVSVFR
jgi:gliding motility-associated-like protein